MVALRNGKYKNLAELATSAEMDQKETRIRLNELVRTGFVSQRVNTDQFKRTTPSKSKRK